MVSQLMSQWKGNGAASSSRARTSSWMIAPAPIAPDVTRCSSWGDSIACAQHAAATSIQAVYVPADDLTDPAPATTFAHLDATTVLSRKISEKGIYKLRDKLASHPDWRAEFNQILVREACPARRAGI